ncbi:hypothetical protein HDV00_012730 [Rhizophlyctis rosea]|nr:hypothetical protein HDV00_012730 [Rhizophlyctis rosea]
MQGAPIIWETVFAAASGGHRDLLKELLQELSVGRPPYAMYAILFEMFLTWLESYVDWEFREMSISSHYRITKEWMEESKSELSLIYEALEELRREEKQKEAEKGM